MDSINSIVILMGFVVIFVGLCLATYWVIARWIVNYYDRMLARQGGIAHDEQDAAKARWKLSRRAKFLLAIGVLGSGVGALALIIAWLILWNVSYAKYIS